jgi:hypothetical protein
LLLVRDSDAHAWTEAFIKGHWLRLDPTISVPGGSLEGEGLRWNDTLSAWLAYWTRLATANLRAWLQTLKGIVTTLAAAALLVLGGRALRPRSQPQELWRIEIKGLLRKLRNIGLERGQNEGLRTFLARVAARFPELQDRVRLTGELYIMQAFGNAPSPEGAEALQRQLRELRAALPRRKG